MVREETDPQACYKPIVRRGLSPGESDPAKFLAMRMSSKLAEADFKGAMSLALRILYPPMKLPLRPSRKGTQILNPNQPLHQSKRARGTRPFV